MNSSLSHSSNLVRLPCLPSVGKMPADGPVPTEWGLARRMLFRFAFVYVTVYMLASLFGFVRLFDLFLGGPWPWIHENLYKPYDSAMLDVVSWVGTHVFHVEFLVPSLLGDATAGFVFAFCQLILAAAIAVVWSVLDRKRPSYSWLYQCFRVAVCFYLAAEMFSYGMVKAIPNQFGVLSAETLMTPVGKLDRFDLLWTFMAASSVYTIFTGIAEVVGGLLLTCRRTRLLGAAVVFGVMVNVVMLNFCYNVPVKLHSSHLLALTLFVASADLRRLVDFFVLGRATQPAVERPLFASARLRRAAGIVITALVLGFLGLSLQMNLARLQTAGHLAPRLPLQGIWGVEEFVADGVVQPPLRGEPNAWMRATIDPGLLERQPAALTITRLDQSQLTYMMFIDADQQTIVLLNPDDPTSKATLTYSEPAPGILVLEGTLDGRQVRITFRGVDASGLPINARFRLISDQI